MERVVTYASSDIGLVRTNNEDAFLADHERGLLIVADGMGGHAAGEVASRITVETISKRLAPSRFRWPLRRARREQELLRDAIREANDRVRRAAAAEPLRRGMGTTVAVLWIRGPRAHVAHVGDSRVYRLRDGALVQLTEDHSLSGEDGALRNVLTRAIGAEDQVEVDQQVLEVADRDVFLLCSDGLTRTAEDTEILGILRDETSGEQAVGKLIDLARARGAPDNVTVALAYVTTV